MKDADAANVSAICSDVYIEVRAAQRRHAPMHSPHEGWSVIFEELEELREEVRADTGTSANARREALQVAAMCVRYIFDLIDKEDD